MSGTLGHDIGDEFAVIASDPVVGQPVSTLAERLLTAANSEVVLSSATVSVSASVGVAQYPEAGLTASTILRNADIAMYKAKSSGKNQAVLFTTALLEESIREYQLRSLLSSAIERNELFVYYQPIIDLRTKTVAKLEALLRWDCTLGSISPAEFIPIAEETGQILEIGRWVFYTALKQLEVWSRSGLDLTMCVNISARQLQASGFIKHVRSVLRETGLDPSRIEFELTEGQVLGFDDATNRHLAELESLGIKLIVDDFGVGFSSLSYLARLSIDGLKIDRALTQDLHSENGKTVAAAIIAMAGHLGVDVVAEGVETTAQAQIYSGLGCPFVQGYLYSKPVPPNQLLAVISRINKEFNESMIVAMVPATVVWSENAAQPFSTRNELLQAITAAPGSSR